MTAPKKKPATPKKSVTKKTETTKKTAVKKKAVVKEAPKAVKKRTTKLKSDSKKVLETKKSEKTTTVSEAIPRFFSWEQWSEVFMQALNAWKSIFFKYFLIVILTLGMNLLGIFTLSAALMAVMGGMSGLENIVANLTVGTMPEAKVLGISAVLFAVWLGYVIFVSVISKIAFLQVIKNQSQNQPSAVFSVFFLEGSRLFLRYVGLALQVFFYVVWPLLVFFLFLLSWDLLLYNAEIQPWSIDNLIPFVSIAGGLIFIATLAYVVYASVRVVFAMPLLIQSQKSVGETFRLAKQITAQKWLFTFLMWGLFVILLYAANIILAELAYLDPIVLMEAADPSESLRLADLLAFLISLFIFGPITTAFQYYLMLRCAKNQSVKI